MMDACRICGCVETDCNWCVELFGAPCSWSEPDLCSACAKMGANDSDRARFRGRRALQRARWRWGRAPGAKELEQHGKEMLRVCVRIDRQPQPEAK